MTADPQPRHTTPGAHAPAGDDSATLRARLVEAILPHVVFDGWSETAFSAAIADTGIDPRLARAVAPRGAADLAVAFHRMCDARAAELIRQAPAQGLRYRDRVAEAIWTRIQVMADQREAVRRAAAHFALPLHAPEGAALVWETADTIWRALGDTSRGFSWASKRATLSAVWSAVLLYWLADQSEGFAATREFIDRRIADVMRIETLKARGREAAGRMRGPGPWRRAQ